MCAGSGSQDEFQKLEDTLELSEEGTGLTCGSGTGGWQETGCVCVCVGEGGEKRRSLQGAASGLLPKIKPLKKSWRGAAGEGRRKRRWERREGTKQTLHTNRPAGNVSNTRLVQRE